MEIKYAVCIRYHGISHYVVDASSPEEAEEMAREMYLNGEPETPLGGEFEEIDGMTSEII
jgi:hypothetical protein